MIFGDESVILNNNLLYIYDILPYIHVDFDISINNIKVLLSSTRSSDMALT